MKSTRISHAGHEAISVPERLSCMLTYLFLNYMRLWPIDVVNVLVCF